MFATKITFTKQMISTKLTKQTFSTKMTKFAKQMFENKINKENVNSQNLRRKCFQNLQSKCLQQKMQSKIK